MIIIVLRYEIQVSNHMNYDLIIIYAKLTNKILNNVNKIVNFTNWFGVVKV